MALKFFERDRHPTWLELFYDLIYAAAIGKLSVILVTPGIYFPENLTILTDVHIYKIYFFRYILSFIPVWWCWTGHTLLMNRFDLDDNIQKLLTLIKMIMVIILVGIIQSLTLKDDWIFVLVYICIRFMVVLGYFRSTKYFPEYKNVAKRMGIIYLLGIIICFISIFFKAPTRYFVFYIGILSDMTLGLFSSKLLKRYPVHNAHLIERHGLFTLILLGDAIAGITLNLSDYTAIGTWIGAVSSFIFLAAIWWIYYEFIIKNLSAKKIGNGLPLVYGHLPIFLSLGIVSTIIKIPLSQVEWSNLARISILGLLLCFATIQILRVTYSNNIKNTMLQLGIEFLFLIMFFIVFFKDNRSYILAVISIILFIVGISTLNGNKNTKS